MTKGKGRLRSVTLREAQQFAGQAEEYLQLALAAFLATLAQLGFTSAGVSPDDIARRFVRDSVSVDVLGPDGLGERTDLRTVGTATTIETRGGTQALERSELLPVRHGDRIAYVPRPSLLGAIIVKAAAVNNDPKPRRYLRDVAFLCSLIDQPLALRNAMTRKDRNGTGHATAGRRVRSRHRRGRGHGVHRPVHPIGTPRGRRARRIGCA